MSGLTQCAMVPSFAPDGARVVFNDYDSGQGHALTTMDFGGAISSTAPPTPAPAGGRPRALTAATVYAAWEASAPAANGGSPGLLLLLPKSVCSRALQKNMAQ